MPTFEDFFEFIKGIHNINPTFIYINENTGNNSYVKGSCLYDKTIFEAKLNLPDELIDLDYPGQDIAISLTLKFNNLINEYLYNKPN